MENYINKSVNDDVGHHFNLPHNESQRIISWQENVQPAKMKPMEDYDHLPDGQAKRDADAVPNMYANRNDISNIFSRLSGSDDLALALVDRRSQSKGSVHSELLANEPLIDGFSMLRLIQQLLNPDIYYLGSTNDKDESEEQFKGVKVREEEPSEVTVVPQSGQVGLADGLSTVANGLILGFSKRKDELSTNRLNMIDEFAKMIPFSGYITRSRFLRSLFKLTTICLSLMAIMISVDKTISTILLCLFSRSDIKKLSSLSGKSYNNTISYEASDVTMSWFVLVLVNISSTYIIFSTIFNGHLLWNLLTQRLFLVSRQFQYKVMLSMLSFVYLEYILNIAFINNLFGWSFVTDDIGTNGRIQQRDIHRSYSVLSRLETFVTDENQTNTFYDILLTIFQFSRGIIRISPYMTISYVIICLVKHIKTIRNQNLLTDSLKKKQKLRLVVKSSKTNGSRTSKLSSITSANSGRGKKRVIFATDTSSNNWNQIKEQTGDRRATLKQLQVVDLRSMTPSPLGSILSDNRDPYSRDISGSSSVKSEDKIADGGEETKKFDDDYRDHIRDFYELESYITNLYIFTGRLNRLMSRQGLAVFFIVHNLVISCSLIVPEAIRGGTVMVYFIRALVIFIGIAPFRYGQNLNSQLGQLSRQIDRIIIHRQFIGRKRDNLVRIRGLLHDIRVNCAGMLNFNIETGLKYLVVAFASAFFIEQEDYKLTRRH